MIKAITFDLDDTLWPIGPVIERAEAQLYAWFSERYPRVVDHFDEAGLRELRERVHADNPHLSHDVTALRKIALTETVRTVDYPLAVAEEAYAAYWIARHEVDLYADVRPALTALRPNFIMGCVSNGNADVAQIGLGGFFDFTLSAAEAGAAKPDPAIFAAARAAAGVRPEECAHVGDHLDCDVLGAARAGLIPVWLDRKRIARPDATRPGYRITRLTELPALVLQKP